jgi:hypothetical protein
MLLVVVISNYLSITIDLKIGLYSIVYSFYLSISLEVVSY